MTAPLVSVIIPTYNDAPCIEQCVRSLQNQCWPNLEIIVINDASTDSTLQILEDLCPHCPQLRVFTLERRSGAATARNLGFDKARGEVLALIDGDMWAPSNWITTLVTPILEGQADVTGGPDVVPTDAPLISRCIGYSMDSLITNAGLRLGDTKLVRYLPGTGNMAIRVDTLQRAGLFDEEFHDTGEDKEWLHRVSESGARFLYLPEALAWHERRPDLLLHAKKQLLSGRRRWDIVHKDPASFEWPHFAPAALWLFMIIAPVFAVLRPVWLLILLLACLLLIADGINGARRLNDARAFPVVIVSSVVIPAGYGLGILWRALEVVGGRSDR